MSNKQRALMLAAAAVIAVLAFVVLKPDDESSDGSDSRPASTAAEGGGSPASPKTKPEPQVAHVRVAGNKPVGGAAHVTAQKGKQVRIEVVADGPEEVHLHGYDLSKEVAPGAPARFNLRAELEGAFEIELERSGTKIATLEVQP